MRRLSNNSDFNRFCQESVRSHGSTHVPTWLASKHGLSFLRTATLVRGHKVPATPSSLALSPGHRQGTQIWPAWCATLLPGLHVTKGKMNVRATGFVLPAFLEKQTLVRQASGAQRRRPVTPREAQHWAGTETQAGPQRSLAFTRNSKANKEGTMAPHMNTESSSRQSARTPGCKRSLGQVAGSGWYTWRTEILGKLLSRGKNCSSLPHAEGGGGHQQTQKEFTTWAARTRCHVPCSPLEERVGQTDIHAHKNMHAHASTHARTHARTLSFHIQQEAEFPSGTVLSFRRLCPNKPPSQAPRPGQENCQSLHACEEAGATHPFQEADGGLL